MDALRELSDVALVEQLTTWAGRVAAGEARLLALIGELDRREAWAEHGVLSCAHWLSWRLGYGPVAARERVRVARQLVTLPQTAAALAAGRLSWSQVRAITRAASPEDEQQWIELTRFCTGEQLERLVRGVRRARRPEQDAADSELAAWRMRPRIRYDDDGTLLLTVRMPAEQGAVVLAALEKIQEQIQAERDAAAEASVRVPTARPTVVPHDEAPDVPQHLPEAMPVVPIGPVWPALGDPVSDPFAGPPFLPIYLPQRRNADASAGAPEPQSEPQQVTLADALVRLAQQTLEDIGSPRVRQRLLVHLDPLSGWARLGDGELLPPGTITVDTLTAHDQGRRARTVSEPLRRLLSAVDGERCRYPGCVHTRNLHAHHLRCWRHGGGTDLANLVLLCERHHTVLHADGIGLTLDADRTLHVTSPDGTKLPHQLRLIHDANGLIEHASAEAASTDHQGERLDLGYAVSVLVQQAA